MVFVSEVGRRLARRKHRDNAALAAAWTAATYLFAIWVVCDHMSLHLSSLLPCQVAERFLMQKQRDRFSFLRHGGRAGAARMSVRQQHLAKVSTSMPHIRVLARRISRSSCFFSAFCLGISGSGL